MQDGLIGADWIRANHAGAILSSGEYGGQHWVQASNNTTRHSASKKSGKRPNENGTTDAFSKHEFRNLEREASASLSYVRATDLSD